MPWQLRPLELQQLRELEESRERKQLPPFWITDRWPQRWLQRQHHGLQNKRPVMRGRSRLVRLGGRLRLPLPALGSGWMQSGWPLGSLW